MPASYPAWDDSLGIPHTDPNAHAARSRLVEDVPAVRVWGATYRNCRPIDGVFELVDLQPRVVRGEERYEVYCSWYGVKPPTTYPRVSVRDGRHELLPSYTGEVVDNISA